jgi:hypothetical protein
VSGDGLGGPEPDGPRPGDPRDPGPRPPARGRDIGWVALAGALAVVTVAQLVALVRVLVGDDAPALGGSGLFLGFLVTVVWLLTIAWTVLGSWRRSVWGCPFSHDAAAPDARRCPRHGPLHGGEEPAP